jgi:hypothetical protein
MWRKKMVTQSFGIAWSDRCEASTRVLQAGHLLFHAFLSQLGKGLCGHFIIGNVRGRGGESWEQRSQGFGKVLHGSRGCRGSVESKLNGNPTRLSHLTTRPSGVFLRYSRIGNSAPSFW